LELLDLLSSADLEVDILNILVSLLFDCFDCALLSELFDIPLLFDCFDFEANVGFCVVVGISVGAAVGLAVGIVVGAVVGEAVGRNVGETVGETVGAKVGEKVGRNVGETVGELVGAEVGDTVGRGDSVGVSVFLPLLFDLLLLVFCFLESFFDFAVVLLLLALMRRPLDNASVPPRWT